MSFRVVNILDMVDTVGEDALSAVHSEFTCKMNLGIETFVRKNAIDFAKKKTAITYLVYGENGKIAAIFTLTHKAVKVSSEVLSNTNRKKLKRYAGFDSDKKSFTVSAFLIAQFGKNESFTYYHSLSGNKLMDFTFDVLGSVQHAIGGGFVYLECEEKKKLLDFYSARPNNFHIFGERLGKDDSTNYIQLFRFI